MNISTCLFLKTNEINRLPQTIWIKCVISCWSSSSLFLSKKNFISVLLQLFDYLLLKWRAKKKIIAFLDYTSNFDEMSG